MKKILLFFIMLMATSIAMAGINFNDIFTEEGYARALAENEASKFPAEQKAFNKEYIELGPKFRGVDFKSVSYAEVKSKFGNTRAVVIDAFLCNIFYQNQKVMSGYFSDATFNDPELLYRKFIVLPGRIPNYAVKAINANVFITVVMKGVASDRAASEALSVHLKKGIPRMIDKTDELPRDRALIILKDLKRSIYKNISKGDEWKQILTDLEIKIQALQ